MGHYDDYHHAEGDWEHQRGYEDAEQPDPDDWHHDRLEEHRVGTVRRQAEQFPFRVEEASIDAETGKRYIPPDHRRIWNRDPAQGATVPHMVGGDPHDVISVNPPEGAGEGARHMPHEDTDLGYDVIARPAPGHGPKAYDVIKPLD